MELKYALSKDVHFKINHKIFINDKLRNEAELFSLGFEGRKKNDIQNRTCHLKSTEHLNRKMLYLQKKPIEKDVA